MIVIGEITNIEISGVIWGLCVCEYMRVFEYVCVFQILSKGLKKSIPNFYNNWATNQGKT